MSDELRMSAYYYSFKPTENLPIDKILSAVAVAGKMFHNTACWNDIPSYSEKTPIEAIQEAANQAAARIATLEAIVKAGDEMADEAESLIRNMTEFEVAWGTTELFDALEAYRQSKGEAK